MPDAQDYSDQGDALGLPSDLAARLRDLSLAPGGPTAPTPATPASAPTPAAPASAPAPAPAPAVSTTAAAPTGSYLKDDQEFGHFLENGPGAGPAPPQTGAAGGGVIVGPSGMPEAQPRRLPDGTLTYLPEVPGGAKPNWKSAAQIQQRIEDNSLLGLDTAALAEEKRKYLEGEVEYSDGVVRAYPGGPKDTPEMVRRAQAPAYGQAAGPAPLEPVDLTVKDNATGQTFKMQLPRNQVPAFFASNPQYSISAGGTAGQQTGGVSGGTSPGGVPVMTPEQEARSKGQGQLSADIIEKGSGADALLGRLQVMRNAANTFNVTPFGGLGTTAQTRLDLAKRFADLGNQMGFQVSPGMQQMITAGDAINKEGGQLVADTIRSLGSREAQQVWGAVGRYMPNLEMSNGGFNVILNSLEQGARRDKDLWHFQDEWLAPQGTTPNSGHSSIDGMYTAFEKQHPIETYASKVLPIPINQAQGNFVPGAVYQNPNGKQAMRMTPEQAKQMPGGGQWYPMN